MADAQKTIDLIFNGVDKTGAATLSALNNAKSFTSSLQNVTQPISDFTVGALKLEAGLLAAGLAMTVFAVKTAGDFDTAFRQISTIVDASASDLAGFKAAILDYAKGSTQPLDQITSALAAAIGSGVEWSQSLDLIATAEKLAVSTRSDLDSTTKVLVSTLNSYGMEIKDAGGLSDLFFKIIDEGDISMTDLAASFAKVAPVAKISGVSLQEVGAAIATLTASGIKPAESIEYLRGAISNIISPSKQGADLAAELGIQFNAAGLKANGLAGLLQQVAEKTGGSADQMKLLFGDISGFTAAATLAGPQAEKFRKTLAAMGNVAGATDAAFAKMAGSLGVSTGKMSSAFSVLLVNIGTPLLDEFGGIANAISKIFKALGESVKGGALKDLVGYIESQFGGIATALEAVAKNLPAALAGADFSGFTGGLDAVLGALKNLFGAIDLTTVEGLKQAIELAGTAFLGLSRYAAGVIDVFAPLFKALVDVGTGAKDVNLWFVDVIAAMGGIATAINIVLPLFGGLLSILTVKGGLSLVNDLRGFPAVLSAAATAAGGGAGLAGALMGPLGLTAAAGAAGYAVGTALNGGISTLLTKLTGSETTLGSFVYDLVNSGKAAADMGTKTGAAAAGVGTLNTAVKDSKNPFEDANNAMLKSSGLAKTTGDEWGKSAKFLELTAAAAKNAADKTAALGDSAETLKAKASGISPIFDALTGKIIGYEQSATKSGVASYNLATATDKAGGSMSKIAAETDKAKEATLKWSQEVAKMAFEEKLKLIDSQTKITVANIEAGAKIIGAAFASIDNSISSTEKMLSSLFGQFKDLNSMDSTARNTVFEQIERENKFREDAFKLQKEMVTAQIAQMKAQTDALIKGDGMIKIDGAGLQPHLEAFMWEILRTIQVRVNKDGLKMLLGA